MIVYRPITKIKALTFDLDDTLYNNMPYIYAAEQALSLYMSETYPTTVSISSEKWQEMRQSAIKEQPEIVNDMGKLRSTVLTKAFIFAGMPSEQIPLAVSDCFDYFYYKRSDFVVDKKIIQVLKSLSSKVPLAAITNGNVNCEAIGIEKYFTLIVHANTQRPMKPHPNMFEYVKAQLELSAHEIMHVGDDLHKDVYGAQMAGFQTAWFAQNREMDLNKEPVSLLPTVQLAELNELKLLL